MVYQRFQSRSVGSSPTPDEIIIPGKKADQRQDSVENSSNKALKFCNVNMSTTSGRSILLFAIVLFAVLAVAGTFVQIYTNIELANVRISQASKLNFASSISVEIFDIVLLLIDEMQAYYFNNDNDYDVFMLQAKSIMQKVDQKLIFSENWPSDLSAVAPKNRDNISSSNALKSALQAMRNLRKAPNGTEESSIIMFYSNVMDSLMTAVRLIVMNCPRFPGWHTFLSTIRLVQSYIGFRRFAVVSTKLVRENRTVTSVTNPIYKSIIAYLISYQKYAEMSAIETPILSNYLRNLSDQEVSKTIDYWNQFIFSLDFTTINTENWEDSTTRHAENIYWIIGQIRSMDNAMMAQYLGSWQPIEIFALGLFVAAGMFVVATVPIHVIGTLRLQNQIQIYHKNLAILEEAFTILYDCIPTDFIKQAQLRQWTPIRKFDDTCVMVVDIANMASIMSLLDFEVVADFLADYFETIESTLRKYNCFKVDVQGDCIALASGAGEKHAIDYCLELVYAALELRDAVAKMNEENSEDVMANLRIGVSLGSCFTRIVYLQVPRMAIIGEVAQAATVMHASCLPMKVQITESLFNRLSSASDLEFILRGPVVVSDIKGKINGYWVLWANENQLDDDVDAHSVASSLMDKQQHRQHRYSQDNQKESYGYAYDSHWEPSSAK